MKFNYTKPEEISINLTPLIDVVFLLLIFFMVTTSFTRETQLQIDLPQANTEAPADSQGLVLIIDAQGQFQLNNRVLANSEPKTLAKALTQITPGDYAQPLRISADANTPHQAVITALDVAANLGFTQLRLTTQEAP